MVLTVALGASLAAFGFGNRPATGPGTRVPAVLQQVPEPAAAVQPDRDRTVLLEVRSAAENKPLPGASVWVRVTGGKSQRPSSRANQRSRPVRD